MCVWPHLPTGLTTVAELNQLTLLFTNQGYHEQEVDIGWNEWQGEIRNERK